MNVLMPPRFLLQVFAVDDARGQFRWPTLAASQRIREGRRSRAAHINPRFPLVETMFGMVVFCCVFFFLSCHIWFDPINKGIGNSRSVMNM